MTPEALQDAIGKRVSELKRLAVETSAAQADDDVTMLGLLDILIRMLEEMRMARTRINN